MGRAHIAKKKKKKKAIKIFNFQLQWQFKTADKLKILNSLKNENQGKQINYVFRIMFILKIHLQKKKLLDHPLFFIAIDLKLKIKNTPPKLLYSDKGS